MGFKRVAKVDKNGNKSYYFTDHLGSTRAVKSRSEISRIEYAPFGEDLTNSSERYKFTGKEDDVSTGLQYFNARYYDSATGRFISEDPAQDGSNWYQYGRNNPLRYVDPNGRSALEVLQVSQGGYISPDSVTTGIKIKLEKNYEA